MRATAARTRALVSSEANGDGGDDEGIGTREHQFSFPPDLGES